MGLGWEAGVMEAGRRLGITHCGGHCTTVLYHDPREHSRAATSPPRVKPHPRLKMVSRVP